MRVRCLHALTDCLLWRRLVWSREGLFMSPSTNLRNRSAWLKWRKFLSIYFLDGQIFKEFFFRTSLYFNSLCSNYIWYKQTRHYDARYYISYAVIMVKHCCWRTWRSDFRYAESEHMAEVSWFPFPKPITQLEKCKRLVKLCGRKNFTVANVNKSKYICSKHSFLEDLLKSTQTRDLLRGHPSTYWGHIIENEGCLSE